VFAPVLSVCSAEDDGETCQRLGCSGSLSCSFSSSRVLNPFQKTVFLLLLSSATVFSLVCSSVLFVMSSWKVDELLLLCSCVALCCVVCSLCASRLQESHLRRPALQAIGLERQGQGSLHLVRRELLAVQQPRGDSVSIDGLLTPV
jgi:hypothetical protein